MEQGVEIWSVDRLKYIHINAVLTCMTFHTHVTVFIVICWDLTSIDMIEGPYN